MNQQKTRSPNMSATPTLQAHETGMIRAKSGHPTRAAVLVAFALVFSIAGGGCLTAPKFADVAQGVSSSVPTIKIVNSPASVEPAATFDIDVLMDHQYGEVAVFVLAWAAGAEDPLWALDEAQVCSHPPTAASQLTLECSVVGTGPLTLRAVMTASAADTSGNAHWSAPTPLMLAEPAPPPMASYALKFAPPPPASTDTGTTNAYLLSIEGPPGSVNHVGVHYWDHSVSNPSSKVSLSSQCPHVSVTVPGDAFVDCVFFQPGTKYLRGHLDFGQGVEFWTDEHVVKVDQEAGGLQLSVNVAPSVTVAPNENLVLPLSVHGPSGSSNHIGAHYWTSQVPDPTAQFNQQAGACLHQAGNYPAAFSVVCSWGTPGTYYVYGHLRENSGTDHWASPIQVHVQAAEVVYTLTYLDGAPSAGRAGSPIAFDLKIEGPSATSNNVGAHYWTYLPNEPTSEMGESEACAFSTATVPATVTVECTFETAGTYYLLGHMELTVEGEMRDFWAAPTEIIVSG